MSTSNYAPLDVIEISGGPHDRGHEYGAASKQLIGEQVDAHYSYYQRYCGFAKRTVLRLAGKYMPFVERYNWELEAEIRGISEGAERSRSEILMLLAYWELMYRYAIPRGCTAIGLTGAATVNGETFVGQNNDEVLEPFGEAFGTVVHATPDSGPSFVAYTYPGFPGQMGINSDGIALCVNTLISDKHALGVPFQAITREILQQRSIGDALHAIARAKRASSGNFLIADANGEIYDVETTPDRYDCFYSSERMVHTNHFLSTKLGVARDVILDRLIDTIIRYNRMNRTLREMNRRASVEDLMMLFKDHLNYPHSICAHVDERQAPNEKVRTADCMIFSPSRKLMWLARGNPCQSKFGVFDLH
jgi:isopenicillin-N N-acyltransferase-like protein